MMMVGGAVHGGLNGVNLEGQMVFESRSQDLEEARMPALPQGTDRCWNT